MNDSPSECREAHACMYDMYTNYESAQRRIASRQSYKEIRLGRIAILTRMDKRSSKQTQRSMVVRRHDAEPIGATRAHACMVCSRAE